ncbi:MAG: hypothetical protein HOD00_09355 [Gemmatimonadales bacterium]|jgi:hypothetical protein|nr:hypothetical protein [Gemmatimonadales bacterium]MBT4186819.1 hypothetical protein [Gemmatimonadales bacterium]MBT4437727.1 hypothetical protein [Gemmatimonadales bacterium]MBT4914546.1 hypothetical protein [Gemmatimonadales bacterium]MBT5044202.1 hypothetical protein [Gemmatimonadales bacterium]
MNLKKCLEVFEMRTFAAVSFAGVTGLVLLKFLLGIMFPLFGMFIGILAMTMKFALIAAVGFFVYSMFKKRQKADEIVVE